MSLPVAQVVPDVLKRCDFCPEFGDFDCASFVPLPDVAPQVIPSASATSGRDLGGWLWMEPERSEPGLVRGQKTSRVRCSERGVIVQEWKRFKRPNPPAVSVHFRHSGPNHGPHSSPNGELDCLRPNAIEYLCQPSYLDSSSLEAPTE